MGVIFGSARGSYGNTARGDQTGSGKEVSTQSGYVHSKGWVVLRAKSPAKRLMLAEAMKAGCKNDLIGYSQADRLALFNLVKTHNYDPAKATEKTNCDCSSLVRVCCYFAGIKPANFTTADERTALLKTGEFDEVAWKGLEYLCTGDVIVTRTKGHTCIVINGGSKAPKDTESVNQEAVVNVLGERVLRNGCLGEDVRELQSLLIEAGYNCGRYGTDGDFGDATEMAVKAFQSDAGLEVDGVAGEKTIAALKSSFKDDAESGTMISITGGNCYVRTDPGTYGAIIGVAYTGTKHVYANETSVDGWYKILFNGTAGWVSGKYGKRG